MRKTTLILLLLANWSLAKQPQHSTNVSLLFDYSGKTIAPIDVTKGFEFAADELRKEGINLIITKTDSGPNPTSARKAAQLVAESRPDIIVGEVRSSQAFVVAEVTEVAKVPFITPFATSPNITQGKNYSFRACFDDNFQGAKLAEFAKEDLDTKSAIVIWDASQLYSKTLASAFKKSFIKNGGSIVADVKINSKISDFSDIIKSIKGLNPDLVFLPVYESVAARFINKGLESGIKKFKLLGGDGWGSSRQFQDLIYSKEVDLEAYWPSHYTNDQSDKRLKVLAKQFLAYSGEKMNASTAIGYDTAMIVAEALKSKNKDTSFPEAIRNLKSIEGLTGTISYKGKQSPSKSLFISKISKNGMTNFKEISP